MIKFVKVNLISMFSKQACIVLLVLGLISCNKKKDENPPKITINSPRENDVFSVLDTILILGSASDDKKLETIEIKLLDQDGFSVGNDLSLKPTSKSTNIIKSFPIDNMQIKSGYHNIQVRAFDGTNISNSYLKVYIREAPLALEGIYIVSGAGTNYSVYKVNKERNVEFSHQLSGDFLASAVNSNFQQFYSSCSYTGSAFAYDIKEKKIIWSIAAQPSVTPYFTAMEHFDNLTFIGKYDGNVAGYSKLGDVRFNINVGEGYYPVKYVKTDKYFISLLEPISLSALNKLAVYYFPEGSGKHQLFDVHGLVKMFKKDEANIFLFKNSAPQIEIYRVEANTLWSPKDYNESISCVEQVDEYTYLIGSPTGIYKYQFNITSTIPFISNINPGIIRYDRANNEVIVGEGPILRIYDYSTAALKKTIIHSNDIREIELLYNK
jgi:hypothetical protein